VGRHRQEFQDVLLCVVVEAFAADDFEDLPG